MRKDQLNVLNDMDEKLKKIDEFNGQLKEFQGTVVSVFTLHSGAVHNLHLQFFTDF